MTSVLRYSSYELMGRTTMFCVCFRFFVLVCFQRQELCRRYLYQQSMMSAEELEAARRAMVELRAEHQSPAPHADITSPRR